MISRSLEQYQHDEIKKQERLLNMCDDVVHGEKTVEDLDELLGLEWDAGTKADLAP